MEVGPRPCERQCTRCEEWKHFSRFHQRTRRLSADSTVGASFDPVCKDCRQIERNERKNADRAAAIVDQRAATRATRSGVPKGFILVNMNYRALVPVVRAMMTPEGRCTSCGHPFLNERDIQLEHREPPRHDQDWARLHARNIGIACASCNRRKASKSYAQSLDDEEEARLSNERHPAHGLKRAVPVEQLRLFSGDIDG
jgi:5-methylcytosine-specific restriction endonuclease McrA